MVLLFRAKKENHYCCCTCDGHRVCILPVGLGDSTAARFFASAACKSGNRLLDLSSLRVTGNPAFYGGMQRVSQKQTAPVPRAVGARLPGCSGHPLRTFETSVGPLFDLSSTIHVSQTLGP